MKYSKKNIKIFFKKTIKLNKKWRESIFLKMNPQNKKQDQKSIIQLYSDNKCKFRIKQ